jgi:hypothetical protein
MSDQGGLASGVCFNQETDGCGTVTCWEKRDCDEVFSEIASELIFMFECFG